MKLTIKDYEIKIEAQNVEDDYLLDIFNQWFDTNTTKQAVLKLINTSQDIKKYNF